MGDDVIRSSIERSFLPRTLVLQLADWVCDGLSEVRADSKFFQGACVLIDISGFTALSAAFCEDGKNGVDQLQVATNGYIGELVACVHRWGGDVVKFAGDALICIFAIHDRTRAPEDHVPLPVLLSAINCAQEVRGKRTDRLTVHVGVTCGEMCFGVLGGSEDHWKSLVSGPCLSELSQCLDEAASMQVVLSAACMGVLRQAASQTAQTANDKVDDYPEQLILPRSHDSSGEVNFRTLPSGNALLVSMISEMTTPQALLPVPAPSPLLEQMIRKFVPTPIRPFLESSLGLSNIAEIREVVTLFLKVSC